MGNKAGRTPNENPEQGPTDLFLDMLETDEQRAAYDKMVTDRQRNARIEAQLQQVGIVADKEDARYGHLLYHLVKLEVMTADQAIAIQQSWEDSLFDTLEPTLVNAQRAVERIQTQQRLGILGGKGAQQRPSQLHLPGM